MDTKNSPEHAFRLVFVFVSIVHDCWCCRGRPGVSYCGVRIWDEVVLADDEEDDGNYRDDNWYADRLTKEKPERGGERGGGKVMELDFCVRIWSREFVTAVDCTFSYYIKTRVCLRRWSRVSYIWALVANLYRVLSWELRRNVKTISSSGPARLSME